MRQNETLPDRLGSAQDPASQQEPEHPKLHTFTAPTVIFMRLKAKGSRLSSAQRLAALIVAQHIFKGKESCRPSVLRIARLMGCSPKTARAALDAICDTTHHDPRKCRYHPPENPPLFTRRRIPARSGWAWEYTIVRSPAGYVAARDEEHRRRMTDQAKQQFKGLLRQLRRKHDPRESGTLTLVGKDVQQARERDLGKLARSMDAPKVSPVVGGRKQAPCPKCGKPEILTADGRLLELRDPAGAEREHVCGTE